jgi:formate hydrogenlyase subunit 3/multisubunit Na+/H+ antiporter MnhD subunit
MLLYPIALPILVGLVCLLIPKRLKALREILALVTSLAMTAVAIYLFFQPEGRLDLPWLNLGPNLTIAFDLWLSPFARLILVAASGFALLVGMYSMRFMANHPRHNEYYAYFLAVLGMTSGTVLANNLILLLFFWEMNGFLLFLMTGLNGEEAVPSSAKTLIITGIGDLLLLLGIVFLWLASGTLTISTLESAPQVLAGWLPIVAFLLMMLGAFAKAGAMPLHSWIPAISMTTPTPVMAYLPASLDKLLGIYLLTRISLHLFVMTPAIGLVLMCVGAITILGAVLMALIQHDFRKMLSFHAVSQVGYMVLGIGTGVPVGVIGGVFHMLNHAIYKCCLFLCGGSVQRQTGRTKFSELGGLAGAMPWTFVACLMAALAISGVPPMNGFVSKWLVYQGILERGGALFPIFLTVAMFGSALTLASFMKLLYSMFWGERPKGLEKVNESPRTMTIPLIVLALFCLAFGVFYRWPVNVLIKPILGTAGLQVTVPGIWDSELAAALLMMSLFIGILIYLAGRGRESAEGEVFLGGEAIDPEFYRVPGTHFYGPVKEMQGLKQAFELAERGMFDIYTYGVVVFRWISKVIYDYIDQSLADLYQEVIPSLFSLIGQILRALNVKLILTYLLWALYAAGIVGITLTPGNQAVVNVVRILACVGMLGWAVLALVESDLRQLLLLATTSQVGFAVLGVTLSPAVAIVYLLSAGIAIVILALVISSISKRLKIVQMERMNGLAVRLPAQFVLFLLAAFWLSGLPPFGNFFGKYLLGEAAGQVNLWYSIAIASAALLTLGYWLRPIRHFLRAA